MSQRTGATRGAVCSFAQDPLRRHLPPSAPAHWMSRAQIAGWTTAILTFGTIQRAQCESAFRRRARKFESPDAASALRRQASLRCRRHQPPYRCACAAIGARIGGFLRAEIHARVVRRASTKDVSSSGEGEIGGAARVYCLALGGRGSEASLTTIAGMPAPSATDAKREPWDAVMRPQASAR